MYTNHATLPPQQILVTASQSLFEYTTHSEAAQLEFFSMRRYDPTYRSDRKESDFA